MRFHRDVMDFCEQGDAFRVKLGTTEVSVPLAIADKGVEAVRLYLQQAVPAAMLAKAEAMETAASALRASAGDIRIPAGI